MKRRLIVLCLILTLMIALSIVPTVCAEGNSFDNYVAIKIVNTPTKDIAISSTNKTIDMFVGENINVMTDICIYKNQIIDETNLGVDYRIDETAFDIVLTDEMTEPSGLCYLKRETFTITAKSAGMGKQFIVEYMDGNTPLFDSITINVHEKNITSAELMPNVTTLKTNQVVDFDLVINGSNTLSTSDTITYTIDGVAVESLDNYKTSTTSGDLDVVITIGDKTYSSKLNVKSATLLTSVTSDRDNYGYMLKNRSGKIAIYTTKGAYPNIQLTTKSNVVRLTDVKNVESDKEGYDKYELTIALLGEAKNENVLITADGQYYVATVNIIDTVTSVAVVPEDTKFESGKVSKFHIVVNGVKDVDTDVTWTVNGVEQTSHDNTISYKAISDTDVKVSAKVDEIMGEYNYTISTDRGSIILTVILSIVVIIISIPILITLKKHSKPDLMAMITKDNTNAIKDLSKLKESINNEEGESILKKALRINVVITRAEKRAQQESFQCENKAFTTALTSLTEAKDLMSDLMQTYKTNPKDVTINIIDNVIFCLENSNVTIAKVKDNE